MPWITILTLIIENAPAAIKTVGEAIQWAQKTWDDLKAASGRDEETITKEELLAYLDNIRRSSDLIQET
jgi:hypothetical protein